MLDIISRTSMADQKTLQGLHVQRNTEHSGNLANDLTRHMTNHIGETPYEWFSETLGLDKTRYSDTECTTPPYCKLNDLRRNRLNRLLRPSDWTMFVLGWPSHRMREIP